MGRFTFFAHIFITVAMVSQICCEELNPLRSLADSQRLARLQHQHRSGAVGDHQSHFIKKDSAPIPHHLAAEPIFIVQREYEGKGSPIQMSSGKLQPEGPTTPIQLAFPLPPELPIEASSITSTITAPTAHHPVLMPLSIPLDALIKAMKEPLDETEKQQNGKEGISNFGQNGGEEPLPEAFAEEVTMPALVVGPDSEESESSGYPFASEDNRTLLVESQPIVVSDDEKVELSLESGEYKEKGGGGRGLFPWFWNPFSAGGSDFHRRVEEVAPNGLPKKQPLETGSFRARRDINNNKELSNSTLKLTGNSQNVAAKRESLPQPVASDQANPAKKAPLPSRPQNGDEKEDRNEVQEVDNSPSPPPKQNPKGGGGNFNNNSLLSSPKPVASGVRTSHDTPVVDTDTNTPSAKTVQKVEGIPLSKRDRGYSVVSPSSSSSLFPQSGYGPAPSSRAYPPAIRPPRPHRPNQHARIPQRYSDVEQQLPQQQPLRGGGGGGGGYEEAEVPSETGGVAEVPGVPSERPQKPGKGGAPGGPIPPKQTIRPPVGKFVGKFDAHRYYYPTAHGSAVFSKKKQLEEPRQPLPLPTCFHNPTGYPCCNPALNDLMVEAYTELEAKPRFHICNINAIATMIQHKAENRFNTSFESVAAFDDFAEKIHFRGDLVCKVELGGKYMLAYATVHDAVNHLLEEKDDPFIQNYFQTLEAERLRAQGGLPSTGPLTSNDGLTIGRQLQLRKRREAAAQRHAFIGPKPKPPANDLSRTYSMLI